MSTYWLEPEEGWNPWRVGQILLDIRTDQVVEIVDHRCEILDEGYDWDESPTDRRYWGYKVVYFDDKTDPPNGLWRAPEDLRLLTDMEVVARSAL